eukprot:5965205-Pleurochrysis_carterae.AAC.1
MPAMQPAIRLRKIQCAAEDVITLVTNEHMADGSVSPVTFYGYIYAPVAYYGCDYAPATYYGYH